MDKRESYTLSIVTIGILFFLFGFVTWLNGPLINILQRVCGTTPFKASLVTLAFYIAYFFMALPSSFILRRTGYKKGISIGLVVMALGALLFIPAAYSRQYLVFLSGLFVVGTGLALLQTAVNPFVTIVGPLESAASRISIMGICNKLAGVISPLVLTGIVMHGFTTSFEENNFRSLSESARESLLDSFAGRMVIPYLVLAGILFVFAILIKISPLPEKLDLEEDDELSLKGFIQQIPQALRIKPLVLGIIAIFVYVGVEVMAGDSLTQFGKSLQLSFSGTLTSFTMAFMVIGYIAGIVLIPRYTTQSKALAFSAGLGFILTLLAMKSSVSSTTISQVVFGWINPLLGSQIPLLPNSVALVAMLGLANALMWPAIWPLTLERAGGYTKIASALLVMGIAGGALIPPLYARMGQTIGFQPALFIMAPIYVYILYFALRGHKVK